MANPIDEFDLSSDEEVQSPDTKRMADLDVDDMDADLFSSFRKKRPNTSRRDTGEHRVKMEIQKPPVQNPLVPRGKSVHENKELLSSGKEGGSVSLQPRKVDDKKRDEDLDDLLDLLTDETPTKKPTGAISDIGKPVTYNIGKEVGGAQQNRQPRKREDEVSKPVVQTKSTFDDDDDDDILTGLGLGGGDDAKRPTPTPAGPAPRTSTSANPAPRISTSAPRISTPASPAPRTSTAPPGVLHQAKGKLAPPSDDKAIDADEEETVQFGGYTPSVGVSSATVSRRRSAKSSSLPARPYTSPATRKSVRFSDVVESDVRPSTGDAGGSTQLSPPEQAEEEGVSVGGDQRKGLSSYDDDMGNPELFETVSDPTRNTREEVRLEHPMFPWQKSHRSVSSVSSVGSASSNVQTAGTSRQLRETSRVKVTVDGDTADTKEPERDSEGSGVRMALQKRVSDMEMAMEREKTRCAQLEEELGTCKKQMREGLEREGKLQEEVKVYKGKMEELEESKRKMELELKEKIEEYKVNLYKVELERDQLQQSLVTSKQRQEEELEALQKSHNLRVVDLEESLTRRETRWKAELQVESERWQEKLRQLEAEKTDAVLAMRRKMDALEASKTNDISRLQSVHRSAIEDVKREHEAEKQHMAMMHREEVEAVKAAHSHTRMLAELNCKVEASSREVGQLQAKLSDSHTQLMEEKVRRNKTHEDHLMVLEERLVSQQASNDAERERLQGLVAKLEAHISQQTKSVEQERWQLQQQSVKLKAQQISFHEERMAAMSKLEDEKLQFHSAREQFLEEQQQILSKCYQEQHLVASERAQVSLLKKKAEERELREKETSNQLREEVAQMAVERQSFSVDQEHVKSERKLLEQDREKLEAFAQEIEKRSGDIDKLCQLSFEVKEKAEQQILEASKAENDISHQWQALQLQYSELREKEQFLARESLSLAEQRRSLQYVPLLRIHDLESSSRPHSPDPDTPPTPHVPNHSDTPPMPASPQHQPRPSNPRAMMGYSPRTSPSHLIGPDLGVKLRSGSVQSYLTQIEHKQNLRQMAAEAELDYQELRRESEFLESLENTI